MELCGHGVHLEVRTGGLESDGIARLTHGGNQGCVSLRGASCAVQGTRAHARRCRTRSVSVPQLDPSLCPFADLVRSPSSINFFMYGNGKQFLAEHLNGGQENAAVHLGAAATAGESPPPPY